MGEKQAEKLSSNIDVALNFMLMQKIQKQTGVCIYVLFYVFFLFFFYFQNKFIFELHRTTQLFKTMKEISKTEGVIVIA